MALTLPYPGMVFVPLDILTAEQQNRIVANYTYISNQFPIASSNIDFTTITSTPAIIGSINNHNIYRKLITGNTGSSQGTWSSLATISGLTNIVSIKGSCTVNQEKYPIDTNHDIEFYVDVSGTPTLKERHPGYFNNKALELIVEYY